MVESPKFDVFLAHNSVDKPQVRVIGNEIKKRGLKPWLDEEQIAPGELFQEAIQEAIPRIKSAAIFIGTTGLGRWQVIELQTLTSQFINRGIRVIPVLLPGVDRIPDNLLFLQQFNWVSFEKTDDAAALYKLEWGITGIRPQSQPIVDEPPKTSILEQEEADEILSQKSSSVEVELKSEKGVDYTKLRDLLAAGKWKEADQETGKVMLQTADLEERGRLDVESIDNFPCEDLSTINQLWLHYSNGKFGFSVQKEIYEDLGGAREYNLKVWINFCNRTGWRKGGKFLEYSELTFNLELASQAHLPTGPVGWVMDRYGTEGRRYEGFGIYSSIAQRLVTCKI